MDAALKMDLDRAIEQLVRAEFSDAAIEAVHVVPDFDADGEQVYRVTVVLKSVKQFDASKASNLMRHIFPTMKEVFGERESSFPILSFLSKADYKRVSAAA